MNIIFCDACNGSLSQQDIEAGKALLRDGKNFCPACRPIIEKQGTAASVPETPRNRRLRSEYQKMVELASRSDLISFQVIDLLPGAPPEKYLVTFTCRGIVGIDAQQNPRLADRHECMVYLDADYPKAPPKMRWRTPIWQPNILHVPPHSVCIDLSWWAASRTLDRLVVMLGEMVQYKNYHAAATPPFPIDKEVAKWVIEFAEPRGIVSKTKAIDTRELCRPQRIKTAGAPAASPPPPAPPPPPRRIKILERPKGRIRILKDEEPKSS